MNDAPIRMIRIDPLTGERTDGGAPRKATIIRLDRTRTSGHTSRNLLSELLPDRAEQADNPMAER